MWFFMVAGIFTVASRSEPRKFLGVRVAVTFAPRPNLNLVVRDTYLGKCPTVDPFFGLGLNRKNIECIITFVIAVENFYFLL